MRIDLFLAGEDRTVGEQVIPGGTVTHCRAQNAAERTVCKYDIPPILPDRYFNKTLLVFQTGCYTQRSHNIGQSFVVKTLDVILSQQGVCPGVFCYGRALFKLSNQCTISAVDRLDKD